MVYLPRTRKTAGKMLFSSRRPQKPVNSITGGRSSRQQTVGEEDDKVAGKQQRGGWRSNDWKGWRRTAAARERKLPAGNTSAAAVGDEVGAGGCLSSPDIWGWKGRSGAVGFSGRRVMPSTKTKSCLNLVQITTFNTLQLGPSNICN